MTTPPPEQLVIPIGEPGEHLSSRARLHLRELQAAIHSGTIPDDVADELIGLGLLEAHDTLPLWVLTNKGRGFPT